MTGEANGDRRDVLRARLIEMRDDMLDRVARRGDPEPGHLPLIAGINGGLGALDLPPMGKNPAARPVVSEAIRLMVYIEAALSRLRQI